MSESPANLELMRLIDRIHLEFPFYGVRRIKHYLKAFHTLIVNGKRIRRLMQLMCLEAFYPKPKTTKRGKDHKVYPYLLGHLKIKRANQVWCTDIIYIPMQKGFVYLVELWIGTVEKC